MRKNSLFVGLFFLSIGAAFSVDVHAHECATEKQDLTGVVRAADAVKASLQNVKAPCATCSADKSLELKHKKLVNACRTVGIAKLRDIAKANNYKIREESIHVSEVDARLLNPWKYVWWTAQFETPSGIQEFNQITQKPPLQKCF